MKRTVHLHIFFIFIISGGHHLSRGQEVGMLSELPFGELLSQKKILAGGNDRPVASPLVAEHPDSIPGRKTFYEEDYDDEKVHMYKKKDGHKIYDILNTSITALSYLAFGGYLLCIIANAVREKRRRIMMAFPSAGPTMSNQFSHVLQHYMTHRPARPFIRFPTVTVHQGGRKRRRRSYPPNLPNNPQDLSSLYL